MQPTDDQADQPRRRGHDGPGSPVAGAAGAGQSQPTDDHAEQAYRRGHGGQESPGADADTTGGRLDIVSSGSRRAADTDCDGYTGEERDKPFRHGFPPKGEFDSELRDDRRPNARRSFYRWGGL